MKLKVSKAIIEVGSNGRRRTESAHSSPILLAFFLFCLSGDQLKSSSHLPQSFCAGPPSRWRTQRTGSGLHQTNQFPGGTCRRPHSSVAAGHKPARPWRCESGRDANSRLLLPVSPGAARRSRDSPPASPPIGRRGNGSRRRAANPEVLLGGGLGDSFEWNRADSSPVREAGARIGPGPSRRRCRCRCRCLRVTAAAGRGSRLRPPAPALFLVRLRRRAREVQGGSHARPLPSTGFPESCCPAGEPPGAGDVREEPRLGRPPSRFLGVCAVVGTGCALPLLVSHVLGTRLSHPWGALVHGLFVLCIVDAVRKNFRQEAWERE